jgi:transcriptional regulator with XRE-family HTH domain
MKILRIWVIILTLGRVINMTISERIFELIRERGYTQKEFSKRTGIAESTISDWKKKGTNPVSDKILIICKVLEVSPYFLLSGSEDLDAVEKSVSRAGVKSEKVTAVKEDRKKEEKAVTGPADEKLSDVLPNIATISKDDDDYQIRPVGDKSGKKGKKKDKDSSKDKKKGDKKDKDKKKKDKDKKKKKKGYLITY